MGSVERLFRVPLADGGAVATPVAAVVSGTSIQDGVRAPSAKRTTLVGSASRTRKCTAATTMAISLTAPQAARDLGVVERPCFNRGQSRCFFVTVFAHSAVECTHRS